VLAKTSSRTHVPTVGQLRTLLFFLALQFIVLLSGLLVFQLEFFSGNFAISIPVLIGKHIFNNLFKIKTRSQFSFARIDLSLNVLGKLGGGKGGESSSQ